MAAEGRCPVVRSGTPPTAHFLRLTIENFRQPLLADDAVTESELSEATMALQEPDYRDVLSCAEYPPDARDAKTYGDLRRRLDLPSHE